MYELDITPRITKELLLSRHTQEDYFEYYLGVPVKKGLFCSPSIIRNDTNPTCSFYKNSKGDLLFKDFAGPSFNFIGCVMYIFSCNYYNALQVIANDFGFKSISKLKINPPRIPFTGIVLKETNKARIQVESKEFSPKELEWWENFGISKTTLKKYNVFSIKSVFLNGNYFNSSSEKSPFFGYYGGENSDGDELWRIYMPMKRNYRFLSNWDSIMIQGAKQLSKSGEYIILTKALKDVMVLHESGIPAIAPNSENTFITDTQMEKLRIRFKNVKVFMDNDLPGVKAAHKYKKKYGVQCVFIRRKYSKDISDLCKKVSRTVFWTIIEELNSIMKNDAVKNTKHFKVF